MSETPSEIGAGGSPARLEPALQRQRQSSRERIGPDVGALIDGAVARLAGSGLAARVPRRGDRAPSFALGNVAGEQIRLGDLLGRGAVVLAFYRGGW